MAAYEEEEDDGYFVIAAAYEDDDDDDGFVIAASSEEEDDDYIKVITTFVPPPLPLSSSSSSHCGAAAIASSSPAPYGFDAEEQISPSSSPATHCVDVHDAAAALWQQDAVDIDEAPEEQQAPTPVFFLYRHRKIDYKIADDDDEVTDEEEDEDDYMYQGYYDLADRGRARHVKRSSGRRGRTKKASTMGRPRGDVRFAYCSGNLLEQACTWAWGMNKA
jgi:hypothetical protein